MQTDDDDVSDDIQLEWGFNVAHAVPTVRVCMGFSARIPVKGTQGVRIAVEDAVDGLIKSGALPLQRRGEVIERARATYERWGYRWESAS